MKCTLAVEFTVEITDGVEPGQITFEIPTEKMVPMVAGQAVDEVTGYCTQEYLSE
jgi:hypothetical protein